MMVPRATILLIGKLHSDVLFSFVCHLQIQEVDDNGSVNAFTSKRNVIMFKGVKN